MGVGICADAIISVLRLCSRFGGCRYGRGIGFRLRAAYGQGVEKNVQRSYFIFAVDEL